MSFSKMPSGKEWSTLMLTAAVYPKVVLNRDGHPVVSGLSGFDGLNLSIGAVKKIATDAGGSWDDETIRLVEQLVREGAIETTRVVVAYWLYLGQVGRNMEDNAGSKKWTALAEKVCRQRNLTSDDLSFCHLRAELFMRRGPHQAKGNGRVVRPPVEWTEKKSEASEGPKESRPRPGWDVGSRPVNSPFKFCPECGFGSTNHPPRSHCLNCGFGSTSSKPSPTSSTQQASAPSPQAAPPEAQPTKGSSGRRVAEVVLWIAVGICGLYIAEGAFDKIEVPYLFLGSNLTHDCGTALEAFLPTMGDVPDACTNSDVYSGAKTRFNLAVVGALVFGFLAFAFRNWDNL